MQISDACGGCYQCLDVCPVKAIETVNNVKYAKIQRNTDKCINCGECASVCPMDAIK